MRGHSRRDLKSKRYQAPFSPSTVEFAAPQAKHQDLDVSATAGAVQSSIQPLTPVRLNLEQLRPFEVVDRQFQGYGVTFRNAIALIPSNPAFPSRNGQTVLMGCPKSGWMEARFERPVEFVSGFVTASSSTVMAVYDAEDRPLAQAKTPNGNLAGSDSNTPPNAELCLRSRNIRRVTFHSFDGQLTLGEFCFG